MLAASDDVTRQHCMRIIEAASSGATSPLQDIASAAALTRDLFGMQDLSTVNAVLAALGRAAVNGLDAVSLKASGCDAAFCAAVGCSWREIKSASYTLAEAKAAGCDAASAKAAGHDEDSLLAVFGLENMIVSGCNLSFILVSCRYALIHTHARARTKATSSLSLKSPSPPAAPAPAPAPPSPPPPPPPSSLKKCITTSTTTITGCDMPLT
jgi:hypothetical protein